MSVKLYSANVCPFAHRTRLALIEKNIEFSAIEIDLANKPEWFSDVSPYQKVPVVQHGENKIWESSVINEYLDEVFPNPPLFPQDPGKKALARIWIEFANTKFIAAFYKLLMSQQQEQQENWQKQLLEHLEFIETEGLAKNSGPYWFGEEFSLVDISFYPWLERWSILQHYRNFPIPENFARIHKWKNAIAQRDSIKSIANPAQFYIDQYQRYANDTADGITAKELRAQ